MPLKLKNNIIFNSIKNQITINLLLIIPFIGLHIHHYFFIAPKFILITNSLSQEFLSFINDLVFIGIYTFCMALVLLPISFLSEKASKVASIAFNFILLSFYASLYITYLERSYPIGIEVFLRNTSDIIQTINQELEGSNRYLYMLISGFALYGSAIYIFKKTLYEKISHHYLIFLILLIISPVIVLMKIRTGYSLNTELRENKMLFILNNYIEYRTSPNKISSNNGLEITPDLLASMHNLAKEMNIAGEDETYPLERPIDTNSVLKDFFHPLPNQPNIVLILVESLSSEYSGPDAIYGSFTPFLDSLASESLFWPHSISAANGSFGVLPATIGALPYGSKGFTNLEIYPEHQTLTSILNKDGYSTSYYYGGAMSFDSYGRFMRYQETDYISIYFDSIYQTMPSKKAGKRTSDYPDDVLFKHSLLRENNNLTPYFNVYFTQTTHNPYLFDQKPQFDSLFDSRINTFKLSAEIKTAVIKGKTLLSSILFLDHALQDFFKQYRQRPEYNNTIFIITGDHRSGLIPPINALSDYHVPIIIYSPLLKRTQTFQSINTHNNIPPSIIALIPNTQTKTISWQGTQLDTIIEFASNHIFPIMGWSYKIYNYVDKDILLNKNCLWKIKKGLNLEPLQNNELHTQLEQKLKTYSILNHYLVNHNALCRVSKSKFKGVPDLIVIKPNFLMSKKKHSIFLLQDKDTLNNNLKYNLTFEIKNLNNTTENYPSIIYSVSTNSNKKGYWEAKSIDRGLIESNVSYKKYEAHDMFNIGNYVPDDGKFELRLENHTKDTFAIKNLKMEVYYTK